MIQYHGQSARSNQADKRVNAGWGSDIVKKRVTQTGSGFGGGDKFALKVIKSCFRFAGQAILLLVCARQYQAGRVATVLDPA